MKRFLQGFVYAGRGVWFCVRHERNFRFHLVTAVYVLALAPFFALTRGQWAALCLTIALVLAAEAVNTAVERLADVVSPGQHPAVGVVKDVAAGAVLLCAIGAVGVAAALFGRPQGWVAVWEHIVECPVRGVALALSGVVAVWFIARGGVRQKNG